MILYMLRINVMSIKKDNEIMLIVFDSNQILPCPTYNIIFK